MRRANIFILFTLLIMLFTSRPIYCEERFMIKVEIVHASQEPGSIDPGFSSLREEFSPYFKYRSYRRLETRRESLKTGQVGEFHLPDGRVLYITPLGEYKNRVRIKATIKGDSLDTEYLARKGSPLVLGGRRYKGGVLMVIINIE